MTFHRPGARVCARTGLVLVPSAGEPAYRVALSSYGPLNPPARGPVGADVSSWSRYDTYDGRTVYTASTRGCAFDEVLAGFRRWLGARDSLAKDAAAVGLSVPEFLRAVDEDWAELGVMVPGHLPRAWRTARLLYTVTDPPSGWWVMLDTAESIATIRAALGERLAVGGVTDVDLALLHGPDRFATVRIAGWVRSAVLDDGTPPHGIVYRSRHAGGGVHAYWLRRLDAGHPAGTEPLTADTGAPITTASDRTCATPPPGTGSPSTDNLAGPGRPPCRDGGAGRTPRAGDAGQDRPTETIDSSGFAHPGGG